MNTEKNYQTLSYQLQNSVATITLNRPDEANGLNTQMAEELARMALQCSQDKQVKAVILTATGRFFCAGGDVKLMSELGSEVGIGLKIVVDNLHKALSVFARMDAPLIVAINGVAAGAGFSMAIAGDLVLAAESASLTMAYSKIGLSPDGGSSYYLPRLIGLRKTQELMFTNRVLSAQEAMDWGLINQVTENKNLLPEAQSLANGLASGAKQSNKAIKHLLLQSFDNSLETQMEIEGCAIAECAVTEDGEEGINSFIEKRKPNFN